MKMMKNGMFGYANKTKTLKRKKIPFPFKYSPIFIFSYILSRGHYFIVQKKTPVSPNI